MTKYSILMAILCFNLFIILFAFVRRKSGIISRCGMAPLLCLGILVVLRIAYVVEFPFTRVIIAPQILNRVQDVSRDSIEVFSGQHSVAKLFSYLWFILAVVKTMYFLYLMVKTTKDISQAPLIIDPEIMELCEQVTGRRIPIAVTEGAMPYIAGFIHPTIFLPSYIYSSKTLRYIFLHEWQHFKSHDQWKKTAVKLLCCLFWWDPLVYLFFYDVEQMLEVNCDRNVLKRLSPKEKKRYLKTLSRFCESPRNNRRQDSPLLLGMAPFDKLTFSKKLVSLKKKLKLFDPFGLIRQRFWLAKHYGEDTPRRRILSMFLCAVMILMFALSYMVVFQPASRPSIEEEDDPVIRGSFPEDSFLRENEDGTYSVMVDNQEWALLKDRSSEPFASMPIVPLNR